MRDLSEQQLNIMLGMQDLFNGRKDKEWKKSPTNWMDGAWTEAAEAFNHTSWEWWKNAGAKPDFEQIKLEIVDAWHFIMSKFLTLQMAEGHTCFSVLSTIIKDLNESIPPKDYVITLDDQRECLRFLAKECLSSSLAESTIDDFVSALAAFYKTLFVLGMEWDELFKLYVGKNTLNSFRQDNGYKTDTEGYKAIWARDGGREDNQFLTSALVFLDITSNTFVKELYAALVNKFLELKKQGTK